MDLVNIDTTKSFKERMQNGVEYGPDKVEIFRRPKYQFHSNYERSFSCEVTTKKSGRYYVTPDGFRYPSITTLLNKAKSDADKKGLDDWRKKVGHKEAKRITVEACNRGTALHTLVEQFIKSDLDEYPIEGDLNGRLFKQIHPLLERITEIHSIETALFSHKLKVAGRNDLVGLYDGKLSIVDFKSSTKTKKEEWILDYMLQTTFYAIAFGELFPPYKIEQIVIVMAVENDTKPQIFIRSPQDFVVPLVEKFKNIMQKTQLEKDQEATIDGLIHLLAKFWNEAGNLRRELDKLKNAK